MIAKSTRHDLPFHLGLGLAVIMTFYPLVFTIFTSFKDNYQFYHTFWIPTLPLYPANFQAAWIQIGSAVFNSAFVTVTSVAAIVTLAALAAYVFARHDFPARNFLFMAILALLMIPGVLTLIPLFLQVKSYGLLNTRWALILPYVAGGQPFSIFILRSFFASQPEELFEAARIDGASEAQIFGRIAVPLAMPILGTVAILHIISIWNDYLWPAVTLSDPNLWTIAVKLVGFSSQWTFLQQWGPLFAGYVISSIPLVVLFMFTMRLFIEGLATGAIKM